MCVCWSFRWTDFPRPSLRGGNGKKKERAEWAIRSSTPRLRPLGWSGRVEGGGGWINVDMGISLFGVIRHQFNHGAFGVLLGGPPWWADWYSETGCGVWQWWILALRDSFIRVVTLSGGRRWWRGQPRPVPAHLFLCKALLSESGEEKCISSSFSSLKLNSEHLKKQPPLSVNPAQHTVLLEVQW